MKRQAKSKSGKRGPDAIKATPLPNPLGSLIKPDPWPVVRLECIKDLGYALVYMKYLHRSVDWGTQINDVERLCEELSENQWRDDRWWWDIFLEKIRDTTENLC